MSCSRPSEREWIRFPCCFTKARRLLWPLGSGSRTRPARGWRSLLTESPAFASGDGMAADELKSWRRAERDRLIAAREGLDAATRERMRQRIDAYLGRSFPGLAAAKLAFCWPIRGEYDARRLVRRLRECGAVTALPVVVAPRQPLVFREWHPGVALA